MSDLIPFLGSKKGSNQPQTRYPVEEPEGINTSSFPRDVAGTPKPGAVSLTEIETFDLLSEGIVDGLVTGQYNYAGTVGNIGYNSVIFSGYDIAPNTSVRWLRSIFYNEVPVVNSQNQFNFQEVNTAFTPGLPNGSLIGQLTNELTISNAKGERLRFGTDFAKVYRILNIDCKAVDINIRIGQLSRTNQTQAEYGDTEESTVTYNVAFRPLFQTIGKSPNFGNAQEITIRGKTSYGFIKSDRVSFVSSSSDFINDKDFLGWELKITRTTPDSTTSALRNQTYIDSITEVYGDIFLYPDSAMVSSRFSAEFFTQIPERAYHLRGIKVKVPDNYDPITKTYNGDWDGTFATEKQWTDNPAWCFYDILTNKRYGLGKYISEDLVDKWTLYQISQYCDTLVADGYGGIEPRFTCNLQINTSQQAYEVINNMASIFRAITYYSAGSIFAVQDSPKPKDFFYLFNNANVKDGNFNYESSSKRNRHTVALVRYNDKNNFYKPAVEYIPDVDGIRRYGIRQLDITAFGCSSRGQALRLGRWALLSETLETEQISFTAGLEGAYLKPGDVFKVFDFNRRAQRYGGRLFQITHEPTTIVTLDSQITGLSAGNLYTFSLLSPTYYYDPTLVTLNDTSEINRIRNNQIQLFTFTGVQLTQVTGVDSGVRSRINFNTKFDTGNYNTTGQLIWAIEGSGNVNDPAYNQFDFYRTISIDENENHEFGIVGLEYQENKFLQIESGLGFQTPGYDSLPLAPNSLQLSERSLTPNTKVIDYSFSMSSLTGVANYYVYGKKNAFTGPDDFLGSQYLVNIHPKDITEGSYLPSEDGTYYFRVYSSNSQGQKSIGFVENSITVSNINPLKDITISSLRLSNETGLNPAATRNTGIYDVAEPEYAWQAGLAQNVSIPNNLSYRITIRQPSLTNTPSPNIFFELTGHNPANLAELSYIHDFDDNVSSINPSNSVPGPFRSYDIVVEAMNPNGNSSAGGNFVTNSDANYDNANGFDIYGANNPPITGVFLTTGNNLPLSPFLTDQWITPDGDVKIAFSGATLTDIEGSYIYTSDQEFSKQEAYGFVPTTKTIQKFQFTDAASTITVSPKYTGINSAYVAASFYDSFDKAYLDRGFNIATGLDLTNVVRITKRGAFEKNNAIFQAWIDMDFPSSTQPTWINTQYNIKSVTLLGTYTAGAGAGINTYSTFRVAFVEQMVNTNYVVIKSANKSTISSFTTQPVAFTNNKTVSSFDVTLNNPVGASFFFGILNK